MMYLAGVDQEEVNKKSKQEDKDDKGFIWSLVIIILLTLLLGSVK